MEERNLARVFSFDLKFGGSRKTRFYRKMFGYSTTRKTTTKDGEIKIYHTVSNGLISRIPHARLGKSVFAVPSSATGKIKSFFCNKLWGPIELHVFTAILPNEVRLKAMFNSLNELIKIDGKWIKLVDAIEEVNRRIIKGETTPNVKKSVETILRVTEEKMKYDWSDEREFSREIESKLLVMRKIVGVVDTIVTTKK